MEWIDLTIWILVAYGMTNGIVRSNLCRPIRELFKGKDESKPSFLYKLLNCMMCFSFWVGLGLGLIWKSPSGIILLDGFLASAACWLIYLVEERIAPPTA